jgi:hypothetical protein
MLLILAATSSPSLGLSHEFRSSGALGTDDLTPACPENGLATLEPQRGDLRGGLDLQIMALDFPAGKSAAAARVPSDPVRSP